MKAPRFLSYVLFVLWVPFFCHAADSPTADAMRLLKSNCFSCHNDEKKKGGLGRGRL